MRPWLLRIGLLFLTINFMAMAQSLDLPITEAQVFNRVDLDSNNSPEIVYSVERALAIPDLEVYAIAYLFSTSDHSRIVRMGSNDIDFDRGTIIDSTRKEYSSKTPFPQPNLYTINFLEEYGLGEWSYIDQAQNLPEPFFTNKTSIIIGFRADLEDGRHYGWLYFTRPNTTYTTPFFLQTYDWQPIPDTAIGAGQPPVIPITTELVSEADGPKLILSWHPAVANWNFETTTNLVPPTVWEPYPAGSSSTEVPLDESEAPTRYFRLTRPE